MSVHQKPQIRWLVTYVRAQRSTAFIHRINRWYGFQTFFNVTGGWVRIPRSVVPESFLSDQLTMMRFESGSRIIDLDIFYHRWDLLDKKRVPFTLINHLPCHSNSSKINRRNYCGCILKPAAFDIRVNKFKYSGYLFALKIRCKELSMVRN